MANLFGTIPPYDFHVQLDNTTGVATVNIAPALAAQLRRSILSMELSPDSDANSYVTRLRVEAYRSLPAGFLATFDAIRAGSFAPTSVVIQGLPSDTVVSAPAASERR